MGHLGQKSAPDALVQVFFSNSPTDGAKGCPVVFAVGDEQRVSSAAGVTDDGRRHAGSKARHSVVLPVKGILNGVVVHCVECETTWHSRAHHFLCGRDSRRGLTHAVIEERLAGA